MPLSSFLTFLKALVTSRIVAEFLIGRTFDQLLECVLAKVRTGEDCRFVKRIYKETIKEFEGNMAIFDKRADYCQARFNFVKAHPAVSELDLSQYPELSEFMRRFFLNLKRTDKGRFLLGKYAALGTYEYASDNNRMLHQLLENSAPNMAAILKDTIATLWNAIDALQLNTAKQLLDEIENTLNQYPEMRQQKAIYATLFFLKGSVDESFNQKRACINFRKAYAYNPYLSGLKEHFLMAMFLSHTEDEQFDKLLKELLHDDDCNPVASAINALRQEQLLASLQAVPQEVKSSYKFKWVVLSWLVGHPQQIVEVEKEVVMEYEKPPETISAGNLPEWMYILNVLMNEFIRAQDVDIYGNMPLKIIHSKHLGIIERFYELADKTEIKDVLVELRSYYNYLKFRKTRDVSWLKTLLDVTEQGEITHMCQYYALMFHDEYDKAYNALGTKFQPFCSRNKMYAAFKCRDREKIKTAILEHASTNPLANLDLVTLLECIKYDRELLSDKEVLCALRSAKGSSETVVKIINIYLNAVEGKKENKLLDDQLVVLDDDDYAIACRLWADVADIEHSIDKMQGRYDAENICLPTLLYWDMLFRCETHNKEFCDLSSQLRHCTDYIVYHYLQKEVNCYSSIKDYSRALEVQEILVDLFPTHEQYLANYAMLLIQTQKFDVVRQKKKLFTAISYKDTNSISNVFFAFIYAKEYETALEFIYPYAKEESFSGVGDNYVLMVLRHQEIRVLMHTVEPEICDGYAVQLSREEEHIKIEALKNSDRTSFLIGHKLGDIVLYKGEKYTITNIGSKYMALYNRLSDRMSVPDNVYGIQMLKMEPDDDGAKLLEKMTKMLPKNEVKDKKEDFINQIAEYQTYKHSLYLMMNDDVVFSSLQLILSDFNKVTFPYHQMCEMLDGYKKEGIAFTDFVLDSFSVILFAYLTKKHGFKYSRKFVVTKSLRDVFSDALQLQEICADNMSILNFWGVYSEAIDKTLGADYQSVLQYLNSWLDQHCKVEFVEERMSNQSKKALDIRRLDILADCMMLAQRPYNVLITEDVGIHSLFPNIDFLAICGNTYLRYFEICRDELKKNFEEIHYLVRE